MRTSLVCGGALLLAGSLGCVTRAASQSPADTTRVPDLVVTATRTSAAPSAIPAATTVISGDDLRARGIRLLVDALREAPSAAVVQTGSYGAVASLFLRGGNSDDVKVLLDGVPLNAPGGAINLANLTTDDIDRVEIVRGPTSVLYGADAVSGVIQIFTRPARGARHAELFAGDGTFGTQDFSGHLTGGARALAISATGSRTASDGFYTFNSAYRNNVGSLQADLATGGRGSVILTARYSDAVAHFPTDGAGNVVDHNQFSTERSLAVGLTAARDLGGSRSLHVNGFMSRLAQGFVNRSDSPADTVGFAFIEDRLATSWRRGADLRIDQRLSRATLSAGAGIERESDDERDAGVSNFGLGSFADTTMLTGNRTTRNGYVQLLAAPVGRMSVQVGARIDDNTAFGTFGTWRAGVSWMLLAGARIWASAGTSFKAPTFSQLLARSDFEVGNPALEPERTRNGELGVSWRQARDRVRMGVTAFWQGFHNLIQYVSAPAGEPTYQNLAAARSRGVELTVAASPARGVDVAAHWTWLQTAVTDTGAASSLGFRLGSPLLRRPASSGGGTASLHIRRAIVAATVTRTGARDDLDFSGVAASRVILPSFTTFDLSLDAPIRQGSVRSPGFDIQLRGENLFNVKYEQAAGFAGRGRALFGGGRLRF